jgi:CubicO group peptidase (beta-lactamase class C family)
MAIRAWIGELLGQGVSKEMDSLVKPYTAQGKFSGSVLVAQHGEIVLSKGYGLANREYSIPHTPQTVSRIGSMTKSFTAIAIMQLVEGGWLSVDDAVSKYLSDFPNGDRITIHHLLSNTSGIPDYIIGTGYQQIFKRHVAPEELTALFRDQPLQFEPGSQFGYTNSGWVLLGVIAEKIAGQSYGEWIGQNIFKPAGMLHSGYEWEQPLIPQRAAGYIDTGSGVLNAELYDETTMHGAGGLYSTTEDLYRWAKALDNGKLLHPETLKRMATPVYEAYGYGWELYTLHGHRAVAHSGGLPGYVSNFVRFPDDDAVIILLSNLGSAAFAQMTESLAAILFGNPYQIPSPYRFVDVDLAILADYVGEYSVTFFGRTSILKFALEGDHLTMDVMGLPKATLSGLSNMKFYARSKGDVEMTFVRDASGVISSIDMNWAGSPVKATRKS